MFREMRRIKQKMSDDECVGILKNGSNGILSLSGDEGYPYGVPMSFVYNDNKIYFHCASEGHKIDSIKRNDKVSFTIVSEDNIAPEKFTTLFKSVIVFGKIRILETKEEKEKALLLLSKKYSPLESAESTDKEINGAINSVTVLELTCEHISGKKGKELIKK